MKLMIDNSEVQKQIDKFEELARKFPGYTAYFQGGADRLKDMQKNAITFSDDEILSDKEFEDFKYVIRTQDFFPHNVKIMNKAINLIKKLKRRGP